VYKARDLKVLEPTETLDHECGVETCKFLSVQSRVHCFITILHVYKSHKCPMRNDDVFLSVLNAVLKKLIVPEGNFYKAAASVLDGSKGKVASINVQKETDAQVSAPAAN
jgi:hypothetical protein